MTDFPAPPGSLLEELPRNGAEEEFPPNAEVASRVSENDWIVDQRYDSSSKDEDSPCREPHAGHSVTISALMHAEAYLTDSED